MTYERSLMAVAAAALCLGGCPAARTTPPPRTGEPAGGDSSKPMVVLTGGGGVTLAKQVKHIYLLDFDQDPAERGFLHGQSFKPLIAKSIAGWKAWLGQVTGADADAVIREFLKESQHLAAAELEADACVKEIRGIARGAGVPFDTIVAYQLYDELMGYLAARKKLRQQPPPGHGTSLGVSGREALPNLIAQNNDLPAFFGSAALVLRITDKKTGARLMQFTWPGVLGQNGINDRGLALAINTLWGSAGQKNGLPMVCIQRELLARGSVDEAVAYLKQVKHGAAMNYLLGDAKKVVTVEAAGGGIKVLDSFLNKPFVAHTNHTLGTYSGATFTADNPSPGRTGERLVAVADALTDRVVTVDVTDVKNLLGGKALLLAPPPAPAAGKPVSQGVTLQSVVFELSPTPTMHLAAAPRMADGYADFSFKTEGEVKAGAGSR